MALRGKVSSGRVPSGAVIPRVKGKAAERLVNDSAAELAGEGPPAASGRRGWWLAAVLSLGAFLLGVAVAEVNVVHVTHVSPARSAADVGRDRARGAPSPVGSVRAGPAELPEVARWIALGGGAEPGSNQVSIEQNLGLAARVLSDRGAGALLFAGGPGASLVQELRRGEAADSLLGRLGELFHPRSDRSARYRPTHLQPAGPATAASALSVLRRALAQSTTGSLLLYVAAHGDPGERPRDNAFVTWGGGLVTAAQLAGVLDRHGQHRPVQLVMSSCFSGGFADIVFRDAEPERGPARTSRCGLFATTWDREASGCDPDPNRRAQQSYSLHFLNALRRADRHGRPLSPGEIDLDGDGSVSLLEAHGRVRVASQSISIPTTTSERWLRHVATTTDPLGVVELPEEDAVIAALASQLQLADEAAAGQRLRRLQGQLEAADQALLQLEQPRDEHLAALQIALLSRWPVLDDPWHPDFAAAVEADRDVIEAVAAASAMAFAYDEAQARIDGSFQAWSRLEVELARVARLVRAYENRSLAARLQRRGGPGWQRYRALLACERTVPGAP